MCYNTWPNVFKLLFCKIVIRPLHGHLKVSFKDNMTYSYLGRILYRSNLVQPMHTYFFILKVYVKCTCKMFFFPSQLTEDLLVAMQQALLQFTDLLFYTPLIEKKVRDSFLPFYCFRIVPQFPLFFKNIGFHYLQPVKFNFGFSLLRLPSSQEKRGLDDTI